MCIRDSPHDALTRHDASQTPATCESQALRIHHTYACLGGPRGIAAPLASHESERAMTLTSRKREASVRRQAGRVRSVAAIGAAALVLTGLVAPGAQAAPPAKDSTFYASPDGRDIGQCQEQHPCSLGHVQEVVRKAAAKGKGDVTVLLADGTYRVDKPLEFRAEDGGREGRTVRWTAAPGAVLSPELERLV